MIRRLLACVQNWPECESGAYDPRCCRFPKSCSCTVYPPDQIDDGDLEPISTVLKNDETLITNDQAGGLSRER